MKKKLESTYRTSFTKTSDTFLVEASGEYYVCSNMICAEKLADELGGSYRSVPVIEANQIWEVKKVGRELLG